MATVAVVVGNPKPRSRTLAAAQAVSRMAAAASGLAGADEVVVDLAEMAPELFDWGAGRVKAAVDAVAGCGLAVVASPTYKASYTGMLKAFLDWYGTTGLSGVTVVPLMVGAGAQHALAVEVHLRPVLVEIGATVPTRGLYIREDQLATLDRVVEEWLVEAAPRLRASLRPSRDGQER